jgi:hypothetical protein
LLFCFSDLGLSEFKSLFLIEDYSFSSFYEELTSIESLLPDPLESPRSESVLESESRSLPDDCFSYSLPTVDKFLMIGLNSKVSPEFGSSKLDPRLVLN